MDNKKVSTNNNNGVSAFAEKIYSAIFIAFIYWASFILTFTYNNGYFDIMDAKAESFFVFSGVFVLIAAAIIIWKLLKNKMKITVFSSLLVSFLLSCAVSTFFSSIPKYALRGDQGWYVGFWTILCLIVYYLAFKDKIVEIRKEAYYLLLIAVFLQYLLIITDAMNLDLLSMRTQLQESSFFAYLGTIGNSNWIVGYLSLLVPSQVCLYMLMKERPLTVVFFVLSLMGLISSVLIGADGIYISFGVCFLFLIPFVFKSVDRIRKILLLVLCFLIALFLISISSLFDPFFRYYDSIGRLLFEHKILLPLLFFVLLLFIVSLYLNPINYNNKKITRIMFVMSLCSLFAVLFFAVHYRGDKLDNYRFELWRISIKQFKQFDLYHKVFGLGPEMLRNVYSSMYNKYGVIYTVAHSEPVQLLLTMGIFGFLLWLLSWICLLLSFINSLKKEDKLYWLYVSIFSYFGQSFVNSATILNLCVLVLFAIHISLEADKEDKIA